MSEYAGVASAMVGFLVFYWVIMLGVSVLMIIASWKVFEKAGEPGWAIFVPFYNSYVMFKISWGNGWYFLLTAVPALVFSGAYFSLIFSAIGAGLSSYSGSYFPFYSFMASFAWVIVLVILCWLMLLVVNIITYVKLAKAFGQGGGFACGLIFLSPVFICIIAFSKNIYYVGIPGKMPPYGQSGGNPSYGQAPNWQNPYYQPGGYQQPYSGASPNQYGPSQGWGWQAPEPPHDAASQQPGDCVKFCPDCGTPMKKDDLFCPRCGKPQ